MRDAGRERRPIRALPRGPAAARPASAEPARRDSEASGVVSAEAQRALEAWVNQLRSELREARLELEQTQAELATERELAVESEMRAHGEGGAEVAAELQLELEESRADAERLRSEVSRLAALCKQREAQANRLRTELRGEKAREEKGRSDARSGRSAMRSVLQERLNQAEAENRALQAQRSKDKQGRRELHAAMREILSVCTAVQRQLAESDAAGGGEDGASAAALSAASKVLASALAKTAKESPPKDPANGTSDRVSGIRQSAEQAAEAIAKKGSAPDRELDASVKSSGTTPPSPGGKRKNAVLKLLSSVPLFRGLTSGERATIARELVTKEFGAGEAVIREGESGDTMYLVERGSAEVQIAGVGRVGTVDPGSVFGELALVNSEPRKATITADSAGMTTLVLDRAIFEQLVGQMGEHMEQLRRRFHAASYSFGRRDYHKLFTHFDRSNSGFLDMGHFRAAVRKDGRMTAQMISERALRTLFCIVDVDVKQ